MNDETEKKLVAMVEETRDRVSRVETDVEILKDDVATLKDDVATLKDNVGTLKDDVATLKDNVGTLNANVATLKDNVGTLNTDVGTLKGEVIRLAVGQEQIRQDLVATRQIMEANNTMFVAALEGVGAQLEQINDNVRVLSAAVTETNLQNRLLGGHERRIAALEAAVFDK